MKQNTLRLVTSAIMLALAAVLSMIKIFQLPLGGSITLMSMLPICVLSIKYGTKWGLFSAFVFALIQLAMDLGQIMTWGFTLQMWIGSIVFDYLVAFTVLGFAGIFRKKGVIGIIGGVSLALFLRFVSHVISGGIFLTAWSQWDNVWIWSLAYNGSFMLPELVFTLIGSTVLFTVPQTHKLLACADQ